MPSGFREITVSPLVLRHGKPNSFVKTKDTYCLVTTKFPPSVSWIKDLKPYLVVGT